MLSCTRKITNDIYWIGGNDRRLHLFENLFPIPQGVSYNSYLIKDEKTALVDTVDSSVGPQFFENVKSVLGERELDYIVVNHMEPDHCATLQDLVRLYPFAKVVGNAKTFQIIRQFYDMDLEGRMLLVEENAALTLGKHTLKFIMAPMVHWPEVMVAYEETEKILFSADGFGTFGALDGNIFSDEMDFSRDRLDEARRYYTNIVGKYGAQVQSLLKKVSGSPAEILCPLHGPVWRRDLALILDKYDKWSRYEPEDEGVVLFYASMYGNTENAANVLAASLADAGVAGIRVYDVSSAHVSYLIAEAFRCSHILLASPTYNGGIYPAMENVIRDMLALNLQNRTFGILENGTWGPVCAKQVRQLLQGMKNVRILEPDITIRSSLHGDALKEVEAMRDAVLHSMGR